MEIGHFLGLSAEFSLIVLNIWLQISRIKLIETDDGKHMDFTISKGWFNQQTWEFQDLKQDLWGLPPSKIISTNDMESPPFINSFLKTA